MLRNYWPLYGVAYPEIDMTGTVNAVAMGSSPAAANHAPVGCPYPLAA